MGNIKAEKLLAFLFGMASHQASDTSWHGLGGLREGLMHTAKYADFNGDYSAAHDYMDTGGDMIGSYMWKMDSVYQWYVPSKDMFKIFLEYNGGSNPNGMTEADMQTCGAWLLVVRTIEKARLAGILYPIIREDRVAKLSH